MTIRHINTSLICLLLLFSSELFAQNSRWSGLFDEYYSGVVNVPDSLINATSRLISSFESSEEQAYIARSLFIRFSGSQDMGYENVAVFIAENYFLNNLLKWDDSGGKELLQLYVDFNKHSLIGKIAPDLYLTSIEGSELSLHSLNSRYTLIYFFDHNCSSCKEGLPELKRIIRQFSHLSIDVYAVYTQPSREALESFIADEIVSEDGSDFKNWHFVYDPDNSSDFLRQYGVISTPRMVLTDNKKIIIGRRLTNSSLAELLKSREEILESIYLRAESFVPEYLSLFDITQQQELENALVPLYQRLKAENRDMYNAVFYHVFEYLASSFEQYKKEAAIYTASNFILSDRDLWFDKWFIDSRIPLIIGRIHMNREGAVAPDIILTNLKGRDIKLHKVRGKKIYLYFFSPDCPICTPFNYELKIIHKTLRRKRVKVISVYTGDDPLKLREYINEQDIPWKVYYYSSNNLRPVHELYETEFIPQTYLLNKDKTILRKGINTIKLKEFLNYDNR